MKPPKIIKGVKAFNPDFTCKGFKFEVGKTYKTDKAVICKEGFHFCENPLDTFSYYSPGDSKFAEVEGSGEIETHKEDSKVACTEIKIGAEVNLHTVISMGVKFILSKVKWSKAKKANNTGNQSAATNTGCQSAATNTGDRSAATNTGYQSAATNTGYQSAATNTGYYSAATNTGYQSAATNTGYRSAATNTGDQSAATVEGRQSIACGLGINNKAKGKKTCWLVLSEWHKVNSEWQIKNIQSVLVDGEKIKEDVWYELKNSKIQEIK